MEEGHVRGLPSDTYVLARVAMHLREGSVRASQCARLTARDQRGAHAASYTCTRAYGTYVRLTCMGKKQGAPATPARYTFIDPPLISCIY
jgi:hypothetical protein